MPMKSDTGFTTSLKHASRIKEVDNVALFGMKKEHFQEIFCGTLASLFISMLGINKQQLRIKLLKIYQGPEMPSTNAGRESLMLVSRLVLFLEQVNFYQMYRFSIWALQ